MSDLVFDLIDSLGLMPGRGHVLEVGCGNGARLEMLQAQYGCATFGIDPNPAPGYDTGTADSLPYEDGGMDVVISGWCLVHTQPEHWFKIAHEFTRVLKDGGHLIIYEYWHKVWNRNPTRVNLNGKWHYWIDWAAIWQAHPGFREIADTRGLGDSQVAITIFKKDFNGAIDERVAVQSGT